MSAHQSIPRREDLAPLQVSVTKPCRVLIVDDDPLVRARLCLLLNDARYQVEVAATAEQALEIVDTAACHIVLTDWEMPGMDGLALCRQLRLQNANSYVYILMLTIRNAAPDLLTGLAAGADDYVVKGATAEEILARLEIGRRISHGESTRLRRDRNDAGRPDFDSTSDSHGVEYLQCHLPREWARSRRYGHCLSVLTCHIDGFQRFSDRFGHAAGDEQLRAFHRGVETSIRDSDWLARDLADSLIVVLPETHITGAHRVAQKLRALFAVHPFSTPAAPIGFTVSVEVISLDGKQHVHGDAQINALLRAAAGAKRNPPESSDENHQPGMAGEARSLEGRRILN
jgi:two-component system, cell cycle response regulator